MTDLLTISLEELVSSLSSLMDHTIAPLRDHHRRTAIAAFHIADQLDLTWQQRHDLIFASAIHDIGAFSVMEQQVLHDLSFESQYINLHARAAYLLLKEFSYFDTIAEILRYHHAYLNNSTELDRTLIPYESLIMQVADHAAVLSVDSLNILDASAAIINEVNQQSGIMFVPEIVEAFNRAAEKENFWLDIKNLPLSSLFKDRLKLDNLHIKSSELMGLVNLFRRIIDFRSEVTSTHTAGVAAVSAELARFHGREEETIRKIKIAGYLHDIGKLIVPSEILEKPSKLTPQEFNIIRTHTYFTYEFLNGMTIFKDIRDWASQHHERLNGRGYPFHENDNTLPFESRAIAVADVFTALTEDRPYRKGVTGKDAMLVMDVDVQKGELDGVLVALLGAHLDQINQARVIAQDASQKEYQVFVMELTKDQF
jgi:HD-GYP domain-containing protein (c-di-GMP phosphodiesterase class II)